MSGSKSPFGRDRIGRLRREMGLSCKQKRRRVRDLHPPPDDVVVSARVVEG